jgi:hypothetical protein
MVALAGPEDEDGGEAEEDRGAERHRRPRDCWVERAIEQETEPVDHRTPPPFRLPTLGGWA